MRHSLVPKTLCVFGKHKPRTAQFDHRIAGNAVRQALPSKKLFLCTCVPAQKVAHDKLGLGKCYLQVIINQYAVE